MICKPTDKAFQTLLSRYEQRCVIADQAVHCTIDAPTLRLSVSEADKSIGTVQQIWDFFFDQHLTRRDVVICVGGGVTTDLAGFAAATYKRGVDYINMPTTLLAMIDAATGGKTGFNYRGLKNSIGAFAQPVATVIDPSWLKTLPAKELLSGFGEMIKTGLLDTELWSQVLQYDLDTMDTDALSPLIHRAITVKGRFVTSDPHEKGPRKALNLGHTFGHALEAISFGAIPHGYAVLYGLIAELYLSVVKLHCPKEPLQQLTQIMLHYYGKPQCKCSDRAQLIALMHQDKKNERAAEINCTLLHSIGSPAINQIISEDEANEAFDYLFSL